MKPQRWISLVFIAVAVSANSGCGVIGNITRRVVVDQFAYNEPTDNLATSARDRILAGSAWREFCCDDERIEQSRHIKNGFQQGFIDHLRVGASEPPAVPPRKYWKMTYQNLEGHTAINEWFTGYRFGLIAAEKSGYRELITIPLSITPDEYRKRTATGNQSNPAVAQETPNASPPRPAPTAESTSGDQPSATLIMSQSSSEFVGANADPEN